MLDERLEIAPRALRARPFHRERRRPPQAHARLRRIQRNAETAEAAPEPAVQVDEADVQARGHAHAHALDSMTVAIAGLRVA